MQAYLPLVFELLIAGAVIGWCVRELILLRRDDAKDKSDSEDGPS
ncbi:hypothetical protein [Alkalicaulis satelles]|nr:hypothetical protein [Alkalicaulis satelles]